MKVLKRAEQRNFEVNSDMYSHDELSMLLAFRYICYFDDDLNQIYEFDKYNWREKNYRVFAEDIDEIKVVYNKEYGFYETIAIMKNGKTLHITL